MCGICEGEPYRGVRSLFNGDLQAKNSFEDRGDWRVISDKVIVYLGESAFKNEENILFRACDTAVENLDDSEREALVALGRKLGRPAFAAEV